MNKRDVLNTLLNLANDIIGIKVEPFDDLKLSGIDSLSLVSYIVAIEETFSFSFQDDDLEPDNLTTINNILGVMEKYL